MLSTSKAMAGRLLLGIRIRFHNHAHSNTPVAWRFASRQPMSAEASTSARQAWADLGGHGSGYVKLCSGVLTMTGD
ncbi:MAG: hypothetical protein RLZZ516_2472 [Cyanobacteriota bacterium]|jgi:hypothetical protein